MTGRRYTRDIKRTEGPETGRAAPANTNQQRAADRLALAERSPVVLTEAEKSVIRLALRNLVVGPKGLGPSHTERVVARELLDRKFVTI